MARSRKEQRSSEQGIMPAIPPALLDVVGAATWLGISRAKLFELMHEEDFPVIVITDKLIRFDSNSLYQWALKRRKTGRWAL